MTNIEKNLERRKKLLNDAPSYSKKNSSSDDDESDGDKSDESAW